MKKIILVGITVLFALTLITCIDAPAGSKEETVPFVQYSADGSRVTINLDGYGDADSARALSKPIAQEAYDFLEVVFRNNATIARASWEKGSAMSITGVPRGAAGTGVDYTLTGGGTLSAAVGNAVMFVGRKVGNEITLFAVGKIVEVDGAPGATVLPTSKSVTFGLAAITGNTVFKEAATAPATPENTGGSFAAVTPADIAISQLNVIAGQPDITVYQLSANVPATPLTIPTTYTLSSSAATDFPIGEMIPAIIAVIPAVSEIGGWSDGFKLTQPKYVLPNGEARTFPSYKPALVSGVFGTAIANNTAIPAAIPITITVPVGAQGVCSFYFSIPVVANTATISNVAGATPVPASAWLVRPGFDIYRLDDGTANSIGGAIFLTCQPANLDTLIVGTK